MSNTERLEVLMTREYQAGNETKVAYTRIGVAFPTKNGGWSVKIEAIPAPKDGAYSLLLMPPREDATTKRYPAGSGPAPASSDDIPFAPF